MRERTVLILGDHDSEFELHARTREAVREAATDRSIVLHTRWLGPDDLELYPGLVAEAHAVVVAPPGPRALRVLAEPIITAIATARLRGVPFLATGAAHGLVFIELARHILKLSDAGSTAFEGPCRHPIVTDLHFEDPHDRDGWRKVELEALPGVDLEKYLGPPRAFREGTDIRHGLNPDYARVIADAGLSTGLIERSSGRPYFHILPSHRWFAVAAFLPQLLPASAGPHPLFSKLLREAEKGHA